MNILIIEDNDILAKNLSKYLKLKDINSYVCHSAEEYIDFLQKEIIDLILLDINLPWKSWIDLLKDLRKTWDETPIIFLTSRDTDEDMVFWLELWADDYIPKPFDYEIVVARIMSVLRRYNKKKVNLANLTKVWKYIINFDKQEVIDSETKYTVFLSNLEYKLFEFLIKNRWKVLERATIYEEVWWEFDKFQLSRNTDIYVWYLRKKLWEDIIKTKKGSGYYVD